MSRISTRDPSVLAVAGCLSRTDLLWVANTSHGPAGHWHARPRDGAPDHDHLATPADAAEYLAAHRVAVPAGLPDACALADLGTIREMVFRLAEPDREPLTPRGRELLGAARFELSADGAVRSAALGWPGFCEDLLIPLLALIPDRARISRCSNPGCRLLFEDLSRNHGRRWCDSAACGNRDRVRRSRRRGPAEQPLPG